MKGTNNIGITKHAVEQFRNRISPQPIDNSKVRSVIEEIFSSARYVSDNENGILFRNEDLMIELIIKQNKIITLYQIRRGRKDGKKN